MTPNDIFQLPYLEKQYKILSEKQGEFETGKFYLSFSNSIEQHALTLLLLSERIGEMKREINP